MISLSDTKMTTTEARQLLEMLKRSLIAELMLPTRGEKKNLTLLETQIRISLRYVHIGEKLTQRSMTSVQGSRKTVSFFWNCILAQPMCIIIQTELKLRAVTGISILKSTGGNTPSQLTI